MNKTGIEYLTHSWNPIAMRCTPISKGCANCWHLRMAKRFAANKNFPDAVRAAYDGERSPLLIAKRLGEPTRHRKPAIIGVQFMGDLFHPEVSYPFVDEIMRVVAENPRHTFLVLTKRAARMFDYFYGDNILDTYGDAPCANLWLGVTVENQKAADERIKYLLRTPAAKHFISFEPLLGSVVVGQNIKGSNVDRWKGIDWAIVGGESGKGARPMHPDWARTIRDDCVVAGVPYFHKQNGVWLPGCKELLEEGYGKIWTVCPLDRNDKHPDHVAGWKETRRSSTGRKGMEGISVTRWEKLFLVFFIDVELMLWLGDTDFSSVLASATFLLAVVFIALPTQKNE